MQVQTPGITAVWGIDCKLTIGFSVSRFFVGDAKFPSDIVVFEFIRLLYIYFLRISL